MIRQVDGACEKPRRLCKTAHQRKTGHRGCKDTYEHKIKQRFGRQNEFAFMIAPPKRADRHGRPNASGWSVLDGRDHQLPAASNQVPAVLGEQHDSRDRQQSRACSGAAAPPSEGNASFGSNATWSAHTENRSMSASLRRRPKCCVAARCRDMPISDMHCPRVLLSGLALPLRSACASPSNASGQDR